ncbi:hypothetical protein [Pseudomonas sp. P108]|uniref:hypothetical protein n=1 Tax=Pseudomonas sp. P108 TaxID=1837993 RepID=UPI002934D8FA|nr:hypothetical protein [Pseudomonas sp. P108]WNZ85158.1 hypothetical protein QOM10_04210 [Pseudomonas sp. P108]
MNVKLSEEEMRQALFGSSNRLDSTPPNTSTPAVALKRPSDLKSRSPAKSVSPKLRVSLRVTKEFEGCAEVFIYDANTLSTLVAEQEAKAEAKKQKYKYFELVSVKSI